MPVRVAFERPDQPEVMRLIDALDAYQQPLYPPDSHHGIDVEALRHPSILFAVARDADDEAIGCGAVRLEGQRGELKRMYTSPARRGRGVAHRVLALLESEATSRGCGRLQLETGFLQHDALRLYERAGYVRRGPFGDYVEDPNSVFMEKSVAAAAAPRAVSVWRATASDVDEVAPLFDAYRQFYGRAADPALARSFLHERIGRRESTLLLARDGEGLVQGFAQLYPGFSSVRASRQYLLNDLFVLPGGRRRGVGRLLLEQAVRFAADDGIARLRLSTAVDNLPAQRLYESAGWMRETGFYEYRIDA
jgi:putative acetyltransferase